MIKNRKWFFTGLVVVNILLSLGAQAAPPAPTDLAKGTEPGLFLRAFKDISGATLLAETGGVDETDGRNYREVTLGAYHDILPIFTIGGFYRRAYGLRHDNDWQSINGRWSWADSNSRGEDFLILDATAKFLVQGLPVRNATAELKSRLLHDFLNGDETLMLRPGLTLFWLKNELPFMNVFLQYEFDLPLNYGHRSVNERWLYLGALYRIARDIDFGGFFADKWQAWSNASAYDNKGGAPFTETAESEVVSALLIWHVN